MIFLPA